MTRRAQRRAVSAGQVPEAARASSASRCLRFAALNSVASAIDVANGVAPSSVSLG